MTDIGLGLVKGHMAVNAYSSVACVNAADFLNHPFEVVKIFRGWGG